MSLLERAEKLYLLEGKALEYAKSPLLLAIRLYWGWQFFLTGSGKLAHVEKTTEFFASLGIPAAKLNVYMAGGTEALGGLLLLAGLGGRLVPFPLIGTMLVAYLTAHRETVTQILENPDAFVTAAPFLFLLASTIVLVFGPGTFSADALIRHLVAKKRASVKPPVAQPKPEPVGAA